MIKGIIFDLGSTLLQFTGDWESIRRQGLEDMTTWYLKKKHVKLDGEALAQAFLAEIESGRKQALQTQTEVSATDSLQKALDKIEAPASAAAFVEAAIKIFFGPEEARWQPYPDAEDTLKQLKSGGYRLGLYSNATDDPLVQRLINKSKLRPWLSPTFSSAGWGWRKPRPEPFELIAKRWGLSPAEIVVVGDALNADILGAQNAGMVGILATMDEPPANNEHRHIKPTATVPHLSDVLEVVARL